MAPRDYGGPTPLPPWEDKDIVGWLQDHQVDLRQAQVGPTWLDVEQVTRITTEVLSLLK